MRLANVLEDQGNKAEALDLVSEGKYYHYEPVQFLVERICA